MFKTQKARINRLYNRFNTGFYLLVLFKLAVIQALGLSFISIKSNKLIKLKSINQV